jgi:hypothetical protein
MRVVLRLFPTELSIGESAVIFEGRVGALSGDWEGVGNEEFKCVVRLQVNIK